jgi:hypothetical protein
MNFRLLHMVNRDVIPKQLCSYSLLANITNVTVQCVSVEIKYILTYILSAFFDGSEIISRVKIYVLTPNYYVYSDIKATCDLDEVRYICSHSLQ